MPFTQGALVISYLGIFCFCENWLCTDGEMSASSISDSESVEGVEAGFLRGCRDPS